MDAVLGSFESPIPMLGGKSAIAPVVWSALGDVDNYIEAFGGGLSVLLARPPWHRALTETVNDRNGFLANLYRAIRDDPAAVAEWTDVPTSELDLHAIHRWLLDEGRSRLSLLAEDPDWSDPQVAGRWLVHASTWVGEGVATWPADLAASSPARTPPRRLPALGNSGQGIRRTLDREWPEARLRGLAQRLRFVRMAAGDWRRVLTPGATSAGRHVGVYLDSPYAGRVRSRATQRRHYGDADSFHVSTEVRDWAVEHGANPRFRIALSAYADEHEMPDGWRAIGWAARPAYGTNSGKGRYDERRRQETLWLSPGCLPPEDNETRRRAIDAVAPRLHRIAAMPDPERRALAAAKAQAALGVLAEVAKRLRQDAVIEMHDAGLSYSEIGSRLGISKARAEAVAKGRLPGHRRPTSLEVPTVPSEEVDELLD